uniref:Protein boule-like n=1 Tax=Monopterus albus TaxID=43700 RepID=A0A3Q3K4C6_MONAL|nr:protein boule-like [Monopterus albus]
MKVAMDVDNQSGNGSSSPTHDVLPPENHADILTDHMIIPNRIFVGGIDYKVSESDLRHFFSQHGAVKEVKIVTDHSGISKGYGFVTFETKEDALKVLHDANGICFKDKKLSIGQAVCKRQASQKTRRVPVTNLDPVMPQPMSCGTFYLTTSTGYPYTYHNGVAYFHCPNVNPPGHHWPPAPPVMLPQSNQPVHQHPAYHHYPCVSNQYQWHGCQSSVPSSSVMHSQQSEYLYQPTDGCYFLPTPPVMEDTTPEFVEPTLQQVYPVYPQRTEGMAPFVLQHDRGKVHLKPKYRRYIHHKYWHYLPEATEPPDASMIHTSQPLM